MRKFAVLGVAAASDVGTHPCFDLRANGVEAGVIIAHRSNVSFDHNVYSPVDIPYPIKAGKLDGFTISINAQRWQRVGRHNNLHSCFPYELRLRRYFCEVHICPVLGNNPLPSRPMARRISQRSLSDEGFVDDSEEEESTQAPEAKEAKEAEQEPTEEGEEDSEEQTEPLTPSLVGQKLRRYTSVMTSPMNPLAVLMQSNAPLINRRYVVWRKHVTLSVLK